MSSVNVRLLREINKRGIDATSPIPLATYLEIRSEALTTKEKAIGAFKIGKCVGGQVLHLTLMPKEKSDANLAKCYSNECGKLAWTTIDDVLSPICLGCSCYGRNLILKTQQKGEKCPDGLWSN